MALLARRAIAAVAAQRRADYYGTAEPFASEAVYFVLTDRFVNGDPANDHRDQGGANHSFDRPLMGANGVPDNIGYLGGDFKGILDNAEYIRAMGFTAVWITPIVDNPDEAFTGGNRIGEGFFADRGKTGYHGYWGVNFYRVDEHLESEGLRFADFTRRMQAEHGLKIVLDIVCNHGSPSYTMPVDQPKFGEIYDADGTPACGSPEPAAGAARPVEPAAPLVSPRAGPRRALQPRRHEPRGDGLPHRRLPAVDRPGRRCVSHRHDQPRAAPVLGASSRAASGRSIRASSCSARISTTTRKVIAEHTRPENGGVSVLDFPMKGAMAEVFEKPGSDFGRLLEALHLADGAYRNPYELMTFYDNHDMARMNATPNGFIDANNWLFTARGIPVVYYGSEIAFMAGDKEHEGNRNYFGPEGIAHARESRIHAALSAIARLRRDTPALQRGLQVNLEFGGDRAAFLRVLERGKTAQTALVLLNKGDAPATFSVDRYLDAGAWRDATGGKVVKVRKGKALVAEVPAHGVRVLLRDGRTKDAALVAELDRAAAALAAF